MFKHLKLQHQTELQEQEDELKQEEEDKVEANRKRTMNDFTIDVYPIIHLL